MTKRRENPHSRNGKKTKKGRSYWGLASSGSVHFL